MYKALDIVNKFIEIDEKEHTKEKLSLLKAMKLLYYAEGCSLASGNGSLFSEKIVAKRQNRQFIKTRRINI